jgi:hypothetical protein
MFSERSQRNSTLRHSVVTFDGRNYANRRTQRPSQQSVSATRCHRRVPVTKIPLFKKRPNFLNSAPISTESALRLLSAPSVCLVKQLKCVGKIVTKFAAKFHKYTHTHTHTHTRCSSSSFIVTLSLIRRTACGRAQFSGFSSTTNAHSDTGQMTVCCKNLRLGAISSRSALSVLVGALFKKVGLRLTTCARAQFSGCSSMTNALSETGQTAICCQNLTLGALSSRSALSVLVGAIFKKFGLFLNTVVLLLLTTDYGFWPQRCHCLCNILPS